MSKRWIHEMIFGDGCEYQDRESYICPDCGWKTGTWAKEFNFCPKCGISLEGAPEEKHYHIEIVEHNLESDPVQTQKYFLL